MAEDQMALSSMEQTNGWELVFRNTQEWVAKLRNQVLSGDLTPERYHKLCGMIEGAERVLEFPAQHKHSYERWAAQRR